MDSDNTRRSEMLKRVGDFGAGYGDVFPASSLGGKMFARVTEAVAMLDQHAVARLSTAAAVRDGLRVKTEAYETLRDALRAISRTARALAIDLPGLDGKLRVPHTNGGQPLLSAARAFTQDVRDCAPAFVAHGLPPTFRKDLDAAIRALETAIRENAAARDASVAARKAFANTMKDALTAIRRLDAIVVNRLRGDRAGMAVWNLARRVQRRTRSSIRAAQPADRAMLPTSALAPPQPATAAPVAMGSTPV
jgi:hypothetical protein